MYFIYIQRAFLLTIFLKNINQHIENKLLQTHLMMYSVVIYLLFSLIID